MELFADRVRAIADQAVALLSRDRKLAAAVAIGALALLQGTSWPINYTPLFFFALLLSTVVYFADDQYWLSFGVAVAAAAVQVSANIPFLYAEMAVALVFYRMALQRRSQAVAWLGLALTIPAALLVVTIVDRSNMLVSMMLYRPNVFTGVLALAVFSGAWFLGYSARLKTDAAQSRSAQVHAEAERDVAEEVARLKESQAALARDVHDVVGHSLAVILAQAESAEYLPDDDIPALRGVVSAIKGSARSALGEVRTVLSATQSACAAMPVGDVRDLIESTRLSGCDVVFEEVGQPVHLGSDEDAVAYRVLQELLTNAIKHGTRDEPIRVVREWLPGELRVEVANRFEPGDPAQYRDGYGLMGIRQRLARTGGRLDVVRRDEAEAHRFIARAGILFTGGDGFA